MNPEELVEHCEALCTAFDKLDKYVLRPPDVANICSRRLNKAATIANIRLYYYIEKRHKYVEDTNARIYINESKELAYEKLSFLLLDSRSKFYELSKHEQMLIMYQKQAEIYGNVYVFETRY